MNKLVYLEPDRLGAEPFTTSDVIAEFAGVQHHTVTRLIHQYENDLREFGQVRFEINAVKEAGARGTKYTKQYRLNEEQAALLMTYLKNTAKVRAFKKELVRQFYAMRTELLQRQMRRTELNPVRRELTDIIREVDGGKWSYKKYTDLAYKSGIGKNATQLRKERNAPDKAKAVDYLTADEIAAIAKRQSQIAVLLDMGLSYQAIKEIVLGKTVSAEATGT